VLVLQRAVRRSSVGWVGECVVLAWRLAGQQQTVWRMLVSMRGSGARLPTARLQHNSSSVRLQMA
jgi:hypothetical protein